MPHARDSPDGLSTRPTSQHHPLAHAHHAPAMPALVSDALPALPDSHRDAAALKAILGAAERADRWRCIAVDPDVRARYAAQVADLTDSARRLATAA